MENLKHPYPKQLFVFGEDTNLGEEVAKKLEISLSKFHIKTFSNGEKIPHQEETVRGRDVYIIFTSFNFENIDASFSVYLSFVRSIKNGQPHRITVIMPKLIWQRQDVENRELREPKLSDFYPELLKTAGMDCMVVLRLHNAASCSTNPPMENLDTTKLIVNHIFSEFSDLSHIAIGAADMGGSKYSRKIAESLKVPLIIVDKDRDVKTGTTRAINIYTEGEIAEKIDTIIFVDDLINSFGSISDAGETLWKKHPHIKNYFAMATHADFGPKTLENIIKSRFSKLWFTNTVPINKDFLDAIQKANKKIEIISVAVLIAQVIDNLHNGHSISALWTKNSD